MSGRRNVQIALLLLAAALLAATFARPTLQLPRQTFRYVMVFDITQSMNVMDVSAAGSTRLEYAKKTALDALSEMPCGTEFGLALFTGHRAFLLITPIEICANYRELSTMLSSIDWRMTWEARSEVAKGLYKSLELLKALPGQTRLVFLTDGHEAPPLNPDVPPQFAGDKGAIRGLLVGVGGALPVPIPKLDEEGAVQGVWKSDEVMHIDSFRAEKNAREGKLALNSGTEHLSSLRETYLQGLADNTGLTYHRLTETAGLSRELKSAALAIPKITTTDVRGMLALAALLALVASLVKGPLTRGRLPLAGGSQAFPPLSGK
ncbi:MAG: VWA domain-containing protein [Gammaproteobacteria bacterium]|nr:VWA domain-containing protein [Gammaproteobacteria bacterium]